MLPAVAIPRRVEQKVPIAAPSIEVDYSLVLAFHIPLAVPGELDRVKQCALYDRHLGVAVKGCRDPISCRQPADLCLDLACKPGSPVLTRIAGGRGRMGNWGLIGRRMIVALVARANTEEIYWLLLPGEDLENGW